MRSIQTLIILLMGLVLVVPTSAQDAPSSEPILTLTRTLCFGTCPAYTVNIYEDGSVVYEGEAHVEVEGEATAMLQPEQVDMLVEGFVNAGYFDLDNAYTNVSVTDAPTVTTSVTYNGETKQIEHYLGDDSAPIELFYLENWVDEILNTSQWTGVEREPVVYTFNMTPVMMIERQPCFGMCPVYRTVIYNDGTVVYIGMNHVDVLGVQVSQTDEFAVQAIAEQTAMNYFDWEENYTQMTVTDLPTVITWLNVDGQMQTITRYDGDPNAPIGLIRFEDATDTLGNVAQWIDSEEAS